jgi:hypothetical protein
MARGITEKDVFSACDALVLAGERPTIERVRQKIGRGSPNTVSPMLDAWFKGLGRRLQDPGAFAPPPDIPEPVLQAAQHFWEVAQASARADVEDRVIECLKPMKAEVDRAQHSEAVAQAEMEAAAARSREARQAMGELTSRLETKHLAHAAASAQAQAAQTQLAQLAARLEAAEALAREADERGRLEAQAAQERATGAERRAALEIESERAARSRADKRADALERRLEASQATAASQLEELVASRTSLQHERREADRLRAAAEAALAQREAADAALVEAKLAIERAEAEARSTQAAMAKLLPILGEAKPKRPASRGRQAKKSG